jgi:hypothetical protein
MICQLQSLEAAVTDFTPAEKLMRRAVRKFRKLLVLLTPPALARRPRSGSSFPLAPQAAHTAAPPLHGEPAAPAQAATAETRSSAADHPLPAAQGPAEAPPLLRLQAGERAKVKSLEEIRATLDANGKCQGLAYTPAMEKFCGGTYRVFKRVDLAFDERKWKLSKMRNVVILDGVLCDGQGGLDKTWTGCDRSCFVWWKEAWLERA